MVCPGFLLCHRACRGAGASIGGGVALDALECDDLLWCG